MITNMPADQNVIERNVHCPFCLEDKAFLISGVSDRTSVIRTPNYGLKFWLYVIFTFGMYFFIKGFPIIEKHRTVEYATYGFCPMCGKTYNAGIPKSVKKAKENSDKLYLSNNKVILGLCAGIAEYIRMPVVWVRIAMVIYSLGITPLILYFVVGLTGIVPKKTQY